MRAFLLLTILAAGCVPFAELEWRPTSVRGSQCFHQCNSVGHLCKAHCQGVLLCVFECNMAAEECKGGCPDMIQVKVEPEVNNDLDCWRYDICGRGECVVKDGRCIPRTGVKP